MSARPQVPHLQVLKCLLVRRQRQAAPKVLDEAQRAVAHLRVPLQGGGGEAGAWVGGGGQGGKSQHQHQQVKQRKQQHQEVTNREQEDVCAVLLSLLLVVNPAAAQDSTPAVMPALQLMLLWWLDVTRVELLQP